MAHLKDNPVKAHPLWAAYCEMRRRCYTPTNKKFYTYGSRGIKVCDRWLESNGIGFRNFVEDMGERPKGLTLDRKDVNGNYEPSNCKWSTPREQAINRTNNRKVTNIYPQGNQFRLMLRIAGKKWDELFATFDEALNRKEYILGGIK